MDNGYLDEYNLIKEKIWLYRNRVSKTKLDYDNGSIDKQQYEYDTEIYNAVLKMWVDSLDEYENREVE